MILAGDIGGTKTRLGIFDPRQNPFSPIIEATFSSCGYGNAESIISVFIKDVRMPIDIICLAVAGPVVGRRAELTNLPWVISEEMLCRTFDVDTSLVINDMAAMANFVPHVGRDELVTLNEGVPAREGNIAVVAPGTGLGEAFLIWNGFRYNAYASEGGHAGFGPASPLELELLQFVKERFGYSVYERVCSGPGIVNIYRFLKEKGYGEEPPWLKDRIANAVDAVPIIVAAAMDSERPCRICVDTMKLFAGILANEAGNMGLKVAATNGVYLGGGIVPHILPFLQSSAFLEACQSKGRMSDYVSKMPVHVILHPSPALYGSALYARDFMECDL